MSGFQVGDRVQILCGWMGGNTGTIQSISGENGWQTMTVVCDTTRLVGWWSEEYGIFADRFEPIEQPNEWEGDLELL